MIARRLSRALALALGAQSVALRLAAQDARLVQRLDPPTLAAVAPAIDAARAESLPTEPLVQKALQGAAKHADGARIAAAVRALAGELADTRAALGPSSTEAELVAGASAVHAGIPESTLARLRLVRPRTPLTVALATLADLVSQGVPADTAAAVVLALAERGVGDDAFVTLRRDIGRDIHAGMPPGLAANVRAQGRPAGGPPPGVPRAAGRKAPPRPPHPQP